MKKGKPVLESYQKCKWRSVPNPIKYQELVAEVELFTKRLGQGEKDERVGVGFLQCERQLARNEEFMVIISFEVERYEELQDLIVESGWRCPEALFVKLKQKELEETLSGSGIRSLSCLGISDRSLYHKVLDCSVEDKSHILVKNLSKKYKWSHEDEEGEEEEDKEDESAFHEEAAIVSREAFSG